MRVVVVGAGLGGLAAALALHRAGHEVQVLERAGELRETGAGIGVQPNGVRALDALGLGGPVRAQAAPLRPDAGLRDRHGAPLLVADQEEVLARTGAPLVVVPRPWLHRLLADALPAGVVRTGVAVTVLDGAGRVVADGTAHRADVVVAADGASSRLRTALFPDHPGLVGSGELAARAIGPAPAGIPLTAGELLDHRTGDRTGILPMADGRVYWYATWRAVGPEDPDARHRWLLDRRADWHPCVPAVLTRTAARDVHVVETARLARPLPSFAVGRVALLGDAAHAMTPDLGQGCCQAFEDALALGAALDGVAPADVERALRRYDAARRPPTIALLAEARRMNRLLGLRGPRARARDAALRLVPRALGTRLLARRFGMGTVEPLVVAGGG